MYVYFNIICIRRKAMSLRLEVKQRPTMVQLLLFQLIIQLVMVLVGSKKVFQPPDTVDSVWQTVRLPNRRYTRFLRRYNMYHVLWLCFMCTCSLMKVLSFCVPESSTFVTVTPLKLMLLHLNTTGNQLPFDLVWATTLWSGHVGSRRHAWHTWRDTSVWSQACTSAYCEGDSYSMFASALAGLELGYMEADNKPSEISSATLSSPDKTLGQKGLIIAHLHV